MMSPEKYEIVLCVLACRKLTHMQCGSLNFVNIEVGNNKSVIVHTESIYLLSSIIILCYITCTIRLMYYDKTIRHN